MSVVISTDADGKLLTVRVSGKLEKEDYERFGPEIDRLVEQHGKLRILVETEDFHGWNAGGLWEDIKFSAHHFNHIERLAIVGEKKWEKGMAVFCKPFTTASVKYFDKTEQAEAQRWIREEMEPA